jgi:hypothetical protein
MKGGGYPDRGMELVIQIPRLSLRIREKESKRLSYIQFRAKKIPPDLHFLRTLLLEVRKFAK